MAVCCSSSILKFALIFATLLLHSSNENSHSAISANIQRNVVRRLKNIRTNKNSNPFPSERIINTSKSRKLRIAEALKGFIVSQRFNLYFQLNYCQSQGNLDFRTSDPVQKKTCWNIRCILESLIKKNVIIKVRLNSQTSRDKYQKQRYI